MIGIYPLFLEFQKYIRFFIDKNLGDYSVRRFHRTRGRCDHIPAASVSISPRFYLTDAKSIPAVIKTTLFPAEATVAL